MYPSSFALAIENAKLRSETESVLGSLRGDIQYYSATNIPALSQGLVDRRPAVLLLDIAALQEDAGPTLRELTSLAPETKIVAVHSAADPHWILQSLRGGAAEFVHTPIGENLLPALARIGRLRDGEPGQRKGRLIGFLSAKGGCGATTIGVHVGVELHRQTASKVLIADFDLSSGLVGFLMKSGADYSAIDAARNLPRLDASLWKAFVSDVKPGLSVLPAPTGASHRDYPEESEFQKILRFVRTQHDFAVIDLGRSLTAIARAALNEIDELFLVSTTEVIALHGLKTIVRGLQDDPNNMHKLHLVLNRAPKMMDLTREELEKLLGRPLYASIPNDYPSLYESYARGNLLPQGSKLSQHFARFAARIVGVEQAKPKRRFALLG